MQSNKASGSRAICLVAAPTPNSNRLLRSLTLSHLFQPKATKYIHSKKVTESHPEANFVTQKETQANTAKHFRR